MPEHYYEAWLMAVAGEAAAGLREQRVPAEGAVKLQDQSAELVFGSETKFFTLKKESGHA